MKILAIGIGGAGGRIVEALFANDRKSSKVTCVEALVIDTDSEALAHLKKLPEQTKLDFSAIEPDISGQITRLSSPAEIDIGEIMARIQNIERSETDAILLCCGLGGRMTDAVPRLIAALRESVTEPLFGMITLPALSEGEKKSAKAADDIDSIAPLLDGTILFDNETWLKKTAARRDALIGELSKGPGLFGLGRSPPQLTPEEITNKLLNQSIIRRISLLLRAGEFRADGGIDLAEVVLDSSEVLNTIKGMGFISVGYAVEHLSTDPLAFLSRLRAPNATLEQRKSAERIIELAKQAIYQEVSVPCDMTSAAKALILVAGPSHEISMKGFMTVRKWIDRSIAGMEMRSGDYPVTSANNVAIIVVLSGLENIPRVAEIREIRDQYRTGVSRRVLPSLDLPPAGIQNLEDGDSAIPTMWNGTELRDDMISLPKESPKKAGIPHLSSRGERAVRPRVQEERRPSAGIQRTTEDEDTLPVRPAVPPKHVAVTPPGKRGESEDYPSEKRGYGAISPSQPVSHPPVRKTIESGYEGNPLLRSNRVQRKNPLPQVPDQDLQTGDKPELPEDRDRQVRNGPPFSDTRTIIRRVTGKTPVRPSVQPPGMTAQGQEKNPITIIRQRKKVPAFDDVRKECPEGDDKKSLLRQEELEPAIEMERGRTTTSPSEESKIGIKDRLQPARDDIFLGKTLQIKEPVRVKDNALLHTEIKTPKIKFSGDSGETSGAPGSDLHTSRKKTLRSSTPEKDSP